MSQRLRYDEAYWSSPQFRADCTVPDAIDYVPVKAFRKTRTGKNPLMGLGMPAPYLGDVYVSTPGPIDAESTRLLGLFYSRPRVNHMEDDIEERIFTWMAADDSKNPLMIIGEVGVGKSAFVRHFFLDRVSQTAIQRFNLPRRPLRWGVLDHRHKEKQDDYANCQAQLSKLLDVNMPAECTAEVVVRNEINAFITNHNLRRGEPLCDSETAAFVRSITDSTETWNQHRMRYLDEHCPEIVIYVVLDNIDPLDPEHQMEIYAAVRSIVISHRCIRFVVCLRPDTAQMGEIRSRLWETTHTVVPLEPVDIAEMLRPRFARGLAGADLSAQVIPFYRKGRHGFRASYPDILAELLRPRHWNEYDISKLIQDVSCGKSRVALQLVHMLLWSPHLLHWEHLGSYHNTVQIWLRGASDIFEPAESIMLNVFDNRRPEKRGNALIRCRVLQYCSRGEQDISCFQFARHFRHLGYPLEDVLAVVQLFIRHDLLRPWPVLTDNLQRVVSASITSKGAFYLRAMLSLSYSVSIKKNMFVHRNFLTKARNGLFSYISDENFVRFIEHEEEMEERFFLERLGEYYHEEEWRRTAEPIAPGMRKEFHASKKRIQEALVGDSAAEELNGELEEES